MKGIDFSLRLNTIIKGRVLLMDTRCNYMKGFEKIKDRISNIVVDEECKIFRTNKF